MKPSLFETLKKRGYIYQTTHETEIKDLLDNQRATFYLGIDPTADSLHIGHFFALMMFKRLQEAGHRGILVIGGATGMVGDPSGKSDMRKMMTKEIVAKNVAEVKKLAARFIQTEGENAAIIVDNAEWMDNFSYIDFLRQVGIHFNVNTMLQADAYKNRIAEGGLTYLEMGYMLMQAYDFVHLNKTYGCTLQIGGSDQWGNIVAGTMLSRKLSNLEGIDKQLIFGLTCPLLMTSSGTKMGKTEKGTLWVARDKTTTYDFYQYFYNTQDSDVEMLLKLFTYIDLETIETLVKQDIIEAKRTMAFEITKLVHGENEALAAKEAAKALFSGAGNLDSAPTCVLSKERLSSTLTVVDALVETNLLPSKSEARRVITQGGFSLNDQKIEDPNHSITIDDVKDGYLLLRAGKKKFLKVVFE